VYGAAGPAGLIDDRIARRGLRVVLAAMAIRWLPGITLRRHSIIELWTFAKSRLLSAFFQYLAQATPRIVIEAILGTQALGYFAIASRLLDQTAGLLTGPLAAVAFPAAARSKDNLEQLRGLLARAIATSTAIAWPAILGLVVVTPIVTPLLLGTEWIGAVLTVQILTLAALRSSVTGFNGAIILGMGRADLRMRLHFYNALLGLLLCPVGAYLGGLEGVAAAMLVRAFVSWPISASYVERLVGFAAQRQIWIAAVSAVPAVAMALAIETLRRSLDSLVSTPVLGLILVPCGMILYAVFWCVLNHRQARTLTGTTFNFLLRQQKKVEEGGA
jgi:O-antigen/teichoic acid export membrane protein